MSGRARLPNASKNRRRSDGTRAKASNGRETGRTQRGRRTRENLARAAREVFEAHGFLHARVEDICDAAETSHGTFYTYFSSKEEIFKEVVDSVEVDLLAVDPVPEQADPVERIRSANRHYLESYRDHARIMSVIQQVATFDAEVRRTRAQRQNAFAHAIEQRTRAYQAEGLADSRVDARYAAQALGGMVAFFADSMYTHDGGFTLDDSVEQLTLLWANAIGVTYHPPGPAAAPGPDAVSVTGARDADGDGTDAGGEAAPGAGE